MKEIIHKNRNKIICFIVTLILALITIYAVFKGSGISPDELVSSLRESSLEGIVPAAVSMLGFIWFEGDALRVILRHMGYPVTGIYLFRRRCVFFCHYPFGFRRAACQCILYGTGWHSGHSSHDCSSAESDHVHTGDHQH